MTTMIPDPVDERALFDRRQEFGLDSRDEVWGGISIVSSLANDEHQKIVGRPATVSPLVIESDGLGEVRPGVNISDRIEDRQENDREPDEAGFHDGIKARDQGASWSGGPDLAVEVVSRYERAREKFDFYAEVNLRELLIVDRSPWSLELDRLNGSSRYDLVGRSMPDHSAVLVSGTMPLTFRLEPGDKRPRVAVARTTDERTWAI